MNGDFLLARLDVLNKAISKANENIAVRIIELRSAEKELRDLEREKDLFLLEFEKQNC